MDTELKLALIWCHGPVRGRLAVVNAALNGDGAARAAGRSEPDVFEFDTDGEVRLEITLIQPELGLGPEATIVSVESDQCPFSFYARDVDAFSPLLVPVYGAAVTLASDRRSYDHLVASLGTRSSAAGSEPSFEQAAGRTRSLRCPTMLGVGRDARVFMVTDPGPDVSNPTIQTWLHHGRVQHADYGDNPLEYTYGVGRGIGCTPQTTRGLDSGILPILLTTVDDGDISYRVTSFVTLAEGPLGPGRVQGSHYLVGAVANKYTEAIQAQRSRLRESEHLREAPVLCVRIEAENTTDIPCYAWFKSPSLCRTQRHDAATGFSHTPSGDVYSYSRFAGLPLRDTGTSILLRPHATATMEFFVPHSPLGAERAAHLAQIDFDEHLDACQMHWRAMVAPAASVCLPDARVGDMVYAGLLHLDLHAYGQEPDGPLAPEIGLFYGPIGTESSPIIQFMDSMGRPDIARRMLQFFLDLQEEDGSMQNFNDYKIETGAVLWSLGEHYRYTRDIGWIEQIAPRVRKACAYLLEWRRRNCSDEQRARGCYGLIEGQCADPDYPLHSFMLNGYGYLGLSRAAGMLGVLDPTEGASLEREAELWKTDIRQALATAMARSPIVPLADGTWCPTAPPWPDESRGPAAMGSGGGDQYSHGSYFVNDSLLGPLYLVFTEVLEPGEPAAEILLKSHQRLCTLENVAYSQPYYSRHDYCHLARGEVREFLQDYYYSVASLADRETYTFWEHYMHACPHKTHEEAWFLMQTRWMLYREQSESLHLLPGVPRAWLGDGREISVDGMMSYFGPVTVIVKSRLSDGEIHASVVCDTGRPPRQVTVRLPHPAGARPKSVSGGNYDHQTERVTIPDFCGVGRIVLTY